jgi:hypothetical protein
MRSPVPSWKSWLRKSETIWSVSQKTERLGAAEYIRGMADIQAEARRSVDPLVKTRSFWRMEKLSAEILKRDEANDTLRDPRLPLEVRPIAHCGMGIGAVEKLGFRFDHLLPGIDRVAHPDYRLFAYESIGAMLAVYEPGPFLSLARGLNAVGLIPMAPLRRPDLGLFLECFDTTERRLLAHGYGRLLYFRNNSLDAAIRAAHRSALDFPSCVRGIAFALSMVNCRDVRRVMSHSYGFEDGSTGAAFEAGLVYALVFWEWMSPGFLDLYEISNPILQRRWKVAREEIDESRRLGFPQAFDLRLPRNDEW